MEKYCVQNCFKTQKHKSKVIVIHPTGPVIRLADLRSKSAYISYNHTVTFQCVCVFSVCSHLKKNPA